MAADVNTGAQSINTESLLCILGKFIYSHNFVSFLQKIKISAEEQEESEVNALTVSANYAVPTTTTATTTTTSTIISTQFLV